ncbi:hypothetical protein DZ860_08530 [Vibrio sinensis]|uniref:Uncharacterized protein n=1 Tax=Vibrio sinensis TaxID=2302434 RepID=A0A3A6QPB9_9VIBR|nr:hypothetical protein DZ860_08530 [Vibrio sinensis]
MLSAHHASNGPERKQGDSSKNTHDFKVDLGDSSHIGMAILSRTQSIALDQKNYCYLEIKYSMR